MIDDESDVDASVDTRPKAADPRPPTPSRSGDVSGMSDLDLIMLLGKVDDDADDVSASDDTCSSAAPLETPKKAAAATSSGRSTSKELLALEDLERELGLGDMNLFGLTPSTDKTASKNTPVRHAFFWF